MDESEVARQGGEADALATVGNHTQAGVPSHSGHRRRLVAVGACMAMLLWGTWVTHGLLDLRHRSPHLVKVQLADIVREYVQGQARSGASADQITTQTAGFLKVLNVAVSEHASRGEIVLLSNAVVDGDVPDITVSVRQEVYARIPHPQPGPAQGMSSQMQQLFEQNGAAGGNGK